MVGADLDPQVKTFLDLYQSLNMAPMHEMPLDQIRAMDVMRPHTIIDPPSLAATEDRLIPGPARDIHVRLYRPTGEGPFPVIVYFHGGGWTFGSVEAVDKECHHFATRVPAVVVNVECATKASCTRRVFSRRASTRSPSDTRA